MINIPDSWKQRREKRKEDWKRMVKGMKVAFHKPKDASKQKVYRSKQDYVLNEIEELNKEHKRIQKSQIWWLIGAICGLVLFPITIGVVIVMILNARKMSQIREQIKEKQREIDIANIK